MLGNKYKNVSNQNDREKRALLRTKPRWEGQPAKGGTANECNSDPCLLFTSKVMSLEEIFPRGDTGRNGSANACRKESSIAEIHAHKVTFGLLKFTTKHLIVTGT